MQLQAENKNTASYLSHTMHCYGNAVISSGSLGFLAGLLFSPLLLGCSVASGYADAKTRILLELKHYRDFFPTLQK